MDLGTDLLDRLALEGAQNMNEAVADETDNERQADTGHTLAAYKSLAKRAPISLSSSIPYPASVPATHTNTEPPPPTDTASHAAWQGSPFTRAPNCLPIHCGI